MGTLRWGSPISLLLSLPILLMCVAGVQAQTSIDDIHIVPRQDPGAKPPAESLPPENVDPELRHLRPYKLNVDLVQVPVTVTDVRNQPVMGLKEKDFVVYEDDRLQKVEFFSDEDAPVSVGLILDLSKSMSNKVVTEREAVEQFFNNANALDDYFVVTFSDRPRLLATSTQSIDDIREKLALVTPDGQTALLDAVYLAIAKMHNAQHRRRALLIVSDGGDNHSRYGLKEIKSIVQEANIEVYAIGIFDSLLPFRSFEEFMGKRWLSEITDATGGRTMTADSLSKVPEIAAAISREMRNQYVLGYKPEKDAGDGRWRKIRVEVSPPDSGTRVQAYYKKGYLAPKK
jgi:Ca-activated chloride channel family protein